MLKYGLTLASEEHPPEHLVDTARAAEGAGFDFVSISDHFHPWLGVQGHSPFVWSVLGAIAEATDEIEVAVGVTCPTVRMHPVINAHAAATTARLLEGRFTWGVGTGENLNEHVTGQPWPTAEIRLEMLVEAVEIIRMLWKGESVTYRGIYYLVEDARVFDLPDQLPPIVVSAFGEEAVKTAAEIGDGLWVTGIPQKAIDGFHEAGGDGPVYSQLTLCWDPDRDEALKRATRLWANTGLSGQLAQDLRTVLHFEQAVKLVDEKLIEEQMNVGPNPEPILKSIGQAVDAGIDHIYLHQVGDPLDGFIDFWESELRPDLPSR
ncbi:MAG: TIGR03557 family F420-dependent LLM class oxidoreductase [Acidimicrobiia bacterium]